MKNDRFYLVSILFLMVLITRFNLDMNYKFSSFFSEFGLIENIQVIILISIIMKLIINKKSLSKIYKKYFYLKLVFFAFITYEEISFLTEYLGFSISKFNSQKEINFHNVNLYVSKFFQDIDLINDYNLANILIVAMVVFICIASYLRCNKNMEFLLLDRKYSYLFLIYPLNLIISNIFYIFNIIPIDRPIINFEFSEMFSYLVLYFDNNFKLLNSKKLKL